MADFVTILRNAIDSLDTQPTEVRARIYQRARDTLASRLVAVGSPLEAERGRASLEEAIAEVERFYVGLASEGSSSGRRSAGQDDTPLPEPQTDLETVVETSDPRSYDATPIIAAPAAEDADHPQAHAADDIEQAEIAAQLPYVIRQTHVHKLGWWASSECSICRKWALCVDPAHCWNRD